MSSKKSSNVSKEKEEWYAKVQEEINAYNSKIKKVKPLTPGHKVLIDAINNTEYVICCGPAGTGKTHIALGLGIEKLRAGQYDKLYLLRPIQECGRNLGAMPGEKDDKISHHMKAFNELFSNFISPNELNTLIQKGKIVIDCAEFYRGCTFNKSFVVLDECQNFTYAQLKMLSTRLGKDSKLIMVGDDKQTDLSKKQWYGYDDGKGCERVPFTVWVERMDESYEFYDDELDIVYLTDDDIVRSGLTAKIIRAAEQRLKPDKPHYKKPT